jgi:hypothetical protein
VYEITPSPSSRPALVVSVANKPVETEIQNEFGAKPQAMVTLGEALYMDSIIEGGVDGEALPMTLDRGVELNIMAHMPGELVNLQG